MKKIKKVFAFHKLWGFDVFLLDDLDKTDETMKKLIQEHYDTIILSNEVAGFSEDIIKKYQKDKDIKIVISLDKD